MKLLLRAAALIYRSHRRGRPQCDTSTHSATLAVYQKDNQPSVEDQSHFNNTQ